MKLVGRNGKHIIIDHDNQTIIVDLEKALSHYSEGKDQIAVSFHIDFEVSEALPVLKDSCTGAIVMRLLKEIIIGATET